MSNAVLEETAVDARIADLTAQLRAMEERLRSLEARFAPPLAAPVAPAPAPKPAVPKQQEEPISEEILMVIAAAVAAFMGKKAKIRRVRRMTEFGVNPWSQQGRVSIQASHNVHWAR